MIDLFSLFVGFVGGLCALLLYLALKTPASSSQSSPTTANGGVKE